MYESFYEFREKPFHVTADPAFLYLSRHHQEALDHLTFGIRQRLGFLMIVGEVGTGKTTLAKTLIGQLHYPMKTALILNPNLSGDQLLKAIIRDFGIEPFGATPGDLLHTIEGFLLEQANSGSTGVLIIDEAQALSTDALEQVRLLSNVETPKEKLIQIVLVGQQELEERLTKDLRLRALNQRIAIRYRIQTLSSEEVAAYIEHRLHLVAGNKGIPWFTPDAVALISKLSRGTPRRINILCDLALTAGFVRESWTIDVSMVEEAQNTVSPEEKLEEKKEMAVNVDA